MNFKQRRERREKARPIASMFLMGGVQAQNAMALAEMEGVKELVIKMAQEQVVNEIESKMVPVRGGVLMMGSATNSEEETDTYQCMIGDYMMSDTNVTQREFNAIMDFPQTEHIVSNLPMTEVNWYQCHDFCKRLSRITGGSYRLPLEAEWEFASKGGLRTRNCKFSGSNDISKVAPSSEQTENGNFPVKQFLPNELGIYDMSGNIWEWCADAYDREAKDNRNKIAKEQLANCLVGPAGDVPLLRYGTIHNSEVTHNVSVSIPNLESNVFNKYKFGKPGRILRKGEKKQEKNLHVTNANTKHNVSVGQTQKLENALKLYYFRARYYHLL